MHPKRQIILDQIDLLELSEIVLLENYDDAILGLVELQVNGPTVLVYSVKRIIQELQDSGMEEDDAFEFFYHNIENLYAGPGSPGFVEDTEL